MKALYRLIKATEKKSLFALRWCRFLGLRRGLAFCRGNRKPGRLLEVTPPGARAPLRIRSATSDLPAFEDTFLFGHYAFGLPAPPRVIVDAGGHIGMVSILLANRYPDARIITLEPEAGNFALLRRNVEPYPNIEPVHAALWKEDGQLDIANPGDSTWSYQVEEKPGGEVEALTMDSVMARFGIGEIDLAKIDIEGAEKEVFEAGGEWLGKVRCLAVELHDRMKPGCSRAFYNATNRFPHELHIGENVVLGAEGYAPVAAR